MTDMTEEELLALKEDLDKQKADLEASQDPEAQAKILQAQVDEQLKEMKENMDRMAEARDTAMKKAVALEEEAKAEKLAKLEAEGKTSEAMQFKLDEANARLAEQEKTITRFSRDAVVDKAMAEHDFRNTTAAQMAKSKIIDELKQGEDGTWQHATGASLHDFVQSFAKDDENAFLFTPKQSSGAESLQESSGRNGKPSSGKSIMEMSTAEMLEAAASGEFGEIETSF